MYKHMPMVSYIVLLQCIWRA